MFILNWREGMKVLCYISMYLCSCRVGLHGRLWKFHCNFTRFGCMVFKLVWQFDFSVWIIVVLVFQNEWVVEFFSLKIYAETVSKLYVWCSKRGTLKLSFEFLFLCFPLIDHFCLINQAWTYEERRSIVAQKKERRSIMEYISGGCHDEWCSSSVIVFKNGVMGNSKINQLLLKLWKHGVWKFQVKVALFRLHLLKTIVSIFGDVVSWNCLAAGSFLCISSGSDQ